MSVSMKCGLQCFHRPRALIGVLKVCRTACYTNGPAGLQQKAIHPGLFHHPWGLLWTSGEHSGDVHSCAKANRPPNPDRLWKKWGMPKAKLQDWGFLSCSGLWWSSPQLAKWSRESSACWGHARETWGLLRETGMFAGLRLRPCISFQQAASSIYFKALLAQFKPCLSRALCSNAS